MGFFENLGKKIGNGVNTTSTRAKDYSERRKLEGEIRAIEKNQRVYFTKMGRLLYGAHINGESAPDFSEEFSVLKDLDEQIAEKQAHINALKDQIICPSCGRLVPSESRFCPYCAAPLMPGGAAEAARDEAEESGRVCHACGALAEPGTIYCQNCGAPLSHRHDTPEPHIPTPPTEPATPEQAAAVFGAQAAETADSAAKAAEETVAEAAKIVTEPVETVAEAAETAAEKIGE